MLPKRTFTIETNLSPKAVRARLEENVQPHRISKVLISAVAKKHRRPYIGKVSENSFTIWKNSVYSNFGPTIYGKYQATPEGTVVHVSIERDSGIALGAIGLLALGVVAFVCFAAYDQAVLGMLFLVGMTFAGLFTAFAYVNYLAEVDVSRKWLQRLL
jgi:hypothetical protein